MPQIERSVAVTSGERNDASDTVFAYIPARGGSKRIPRKNIRPLGGVPVIERTVRQLATLTFVSQVFVSTDDPEIRAVAEASGAVCLEPRAPSLSNDDAGFIDLIHNDLPRFSAAAGGGREVLFALATAALVPAASYVAAYAHYRQRRPEVLMSCEQPHVSPFWAMTQKSDGYLAPLFPDKVLINSQNLPRALADAGLFYFFNLDNMKRYRSLKLVDRLLPFEVAPEFSVDVDTPDDWQRLETRFAALQQRSRG